MTLATSSGVSGSTAGSTTSGAAAFSALAVSSWAEIRGRIEHLLILVNRNEIEMLGSKLEWPFLTGGKEDKIGEAFPNFAQEAPRFLQRNFDNRALISYIHL